MSFDPSKQDPFSDMFANERKKKDDSVLEIFGTEKREFDPVDDDDLDDYAPPTIVPAKPTEPEVIAQPETVTPAPEIEKRAARTDSDRGRQSRPSTSPVAAREKDATDSSNAEKPKAKKQSNWEKLAAALGLGKSKSRSAQTESEQAEAEEIAPSADYLAANESSERATYSTEPAARASDDPNAEDIFGEPLVRELNPFDQLFEPSDEAPAAASEAKQCGFLDEVDQDYIEFEVEDLNPRETPRDGGRRRRRRRRSPDSRDEQPRHEQTGEDQNQARGAASRDAQSRESRQRPATQRTSESRQPEPVRSPENFDGDRDVRRANERDAEQADDRGNRGRRPRRRRTSEMKPSNEESGSRRSDDRSGGERGERQPLETDEGRGSRRRRPRNERDRNDIDPDLDSIPNDFVDDDFDDVSERDARKVVTTWRSAIESMIEKNIANHEKSSRQRPKGRGPGKGRR
ncbi:MAG: hypothetical protein R3C03_02515 [Pirellulaceae bacterium]